MLTPEDFEPWIGRAVRLSTVPEPVEITLARVDRRAVQKWIPREPFSLFFEAPLSVYLLDDSYEMDCGKGGPHVIHITQLYPTETHRIYQAVFS